MEADTVNDHIARAIALIPGIEQVAPLTVAFESEDYEEAFSTIHDMTLISGVVN